MRVKRITAAVLLLMLAVALQPAQGEAAVPAAQKEREDFFGAFTLVPENPLPGDLPYLLHLISLEPPEETAKPALSPLAEAAAKFAALISGAGAHYEESTAFMGMKGNWLYVDNETGALVKNQYGKGKDGMSVTLTMLDTGGVGDDAFLPPQGVSFTGP